MRRSVLLRSRVHSAATGPSRTAVANAVPSNSQRFVAAATVTTTGAAAAAASGLLRPTSALLAPKKKPPSSADAWGEGDDAVSDDDLADFYSPDKSAEDFFGDDADFGGWGNNSASSSPSTGAGAASPSSPPAKAGGSKVRVVSELSGDRQRIKGTGIAADPQQLRFDQPPEQFDKTVAVGVFGGSAFVNPSTTAEEKRLAAEAEAAAAAEAGKNGAAGGAGAGGAASSSAWGGANNAGTDYDFGAGSPYGSNTGATSYCSSYTNSNAAAASLDEFQPLEDDDTSIADPEWTAPRVHKRPARSTPSAASDSAPADAGNGEGQQQEGSSTAAAAAGEEGREGAVEYVEEVIEVAASAIDPYYAALPMEELVEAVVSYLRSCDNPKLVDAEEEGQLFPALLSRIDDCPIPLLLSVVEGEWRASTMDRYGTVFKDLVRDRVLQDAEELDPMTVQRAIVVMGISAGRRKRDLDFFKTLGKLFVSHINSYKDPNDLVRVMTAFNRAKIVPPNSFLALMGRRFPVLNKRHPLRALPAYRVFSNLYRMGHDQMNPFRYLADRMFETIMANLKKEKIRIKKLERAQRSGSEEAVEAVRRDIEADRVDSMRKLAAETKEEEYQKSALEQIAEDQWGGAEHGAEAVRRRFLELSEVRPIHLTKMLIVLARFGAPHQQYFRPLLAPLIIPSVPHFPPPSLSRIIRAIRLFKTTDESIYRAVMEHLVALGPKKVVMSDVLEMLRALAHADAPVPSNTEAFMQLCYSIFTDEDRLRARDMCVVASDLLLFSKKEDVTIPALDTMMRLIEVFARRMVFLMEIGVLSLTHAEILEDIARQLKIEDTNGAIAAMKEKRREVNRDGDDEYYMMIDIDVRETFFKIQLVDNFNTYGPWRPVPGLLQVDFKQALTNVRVDSVVEAAHLYEQAYPRQLRVTVKRLLSKAILMKMSEEGEDVIENGEIIVRPNAPIGFSASNVRKFANMLRVTPLRRVRRSPLTWRFLLEKAKAVGDDEVIALCEQSLAFLAAAKKSGTPQSALEKETERDEDGEEVSIYVEDEALLKSIAAQ